MPRSEEELLIATARLLGTATGRVSTDAVTLTLAATEEERIILRRFVLPTLGWRQRGGAYIRGKRIPRLTVRDGHVVPAESTPQDTIEATLAVFTGFLGTVTNDDAWKASGSEELYTALIARSIARGMRGLGFERIKRRAEGKISIVYVRGDRIKDRRRLIYVFRDMATGAITVTYDPHPPSIPFTLPPKLSYNPFNPNPRGPLLMTAPPAISLTELLTATRDHAARTDDTPHQTAAAWRVAEATADAALAAWFAARGLTLMLDRPPPPPSVRDRATPYVLPNDDGVWRGYTVEVADLRDEHSNRDLTPALLAIRFVFWEGFDDEESVSVLDIWQLDFDYVRARPCGFQRGFQFNGFRFAAAPVRAALAEADRRLAEGA